MNLNLSAAGSSVLAAFASSLCCITPILAAISGVTGMAGAFSWVEPARPYLMTVTVGVLGLAWYLRLRPQPKDQCGCDAPRKTPFVQSKSFLGVVTVLAVALMAFPAYASLLTGDEGNNPKENYAINPNAKIAEFAVEGMTCASCETHIAQVLDALPGVIHTTVSYERGNAVVKFDNHAVSIAQIQAGITEAGYGIVKTTSLEHFAFFARQTSIPLDSRNVAFYEVPLVCGAAPEIGCGSRVKPMFLDAGNEPRIREAWINRPGTAIAIVWNDPIPDTREQKKIARTLFEKHGIEFTIVSKPSDVQYLVSSLAGADKWYKGLDVDELSIEEAGVIADSATVLAQAEGLITAQEATEIKSEIEAYFQHELTQVRTLENLNSAETQDRWYEAAYQIYVRRIGEERAMAVKKFYADRKAKNEACESGKRSCCDKKGKQECSQ
jgi:copper chaperone CopZ